MRIACLLLAAGEGRRFGSCKQLAEIDGKPLLAHAFGPLVSLFGDNLYVVLGAYADDIQPAIENSARVISNVDWQNGMGSSIACGMAEIEKQGDWDGIMITLADQPLLTRSDYRELLERFDGDRVVAAYYAGNPGVPAIFPNSRFNELQQLSGDRGAKALLGDCGEKIVLVPMPGAATDIDTREDLKTYRSRQN